MIDTKTSIRYLFHLVSNIPYGSVGARSVETTILKNKGSCSTKHVLLADLLKREGVEVRYFIGKSDLRGLNKFLPDTMRLEGAVYDYHNFLKIQVDGSWYVADATFGLREQQIGFPSNVNWSLEGDCKILFPVLESEEVDDIFLAKEKKIAGLTKDEQATRSKYFSNLINYMSEKYE